MLEEVTRYGQSMRTPEVRILEDRAQDYWLIRILDSDAGLGT